MNPITMLDVAEARGVQGNGDGTISAGALAAVGVPIMGGCATCYATVGAYNAYPSTTGYWQCADDIGDLGFATVADFEAFVVS